MPYVRLYGPSKKSLFLAKDCSQTGPASKQGATKEEIAETLGVAIAVNAGATLVFAARVMDALTERP